MTPPDRRVITFYSYKGGVGRTMALANVAHRLANVHALRVIAVDWDLEAPGLHRFFGLTSERAAKARGVLDYFLAWREALERQAAGPPSVEAWLIPIVDEQHKPRHGAVSLLTAGALDEQYQRRLAGFHWQDFYENGSGAAAVETLRDQLTERADVVLIDSRTGLTDAGGICTLQVPDGVVLMTTPNGQSHAGIERVAESIFNAPPASRAGRERARMWFVPSRVPSVEETYLSDQWFAEKRPWFEQGVARGMWRKEDHPQGIRSHEIPHRSRWSLREVVLDERVGVDPKDPLWQAYERLTDALLRWVRGEPSVPLEVPSKAQNGAADVRDVAALESAANDAERRGDMLGMGMSLVDLALALYAIGRDEEAIRKAEQAGGIFLSRGALDDYARSLYVLTIALGGSKRWKEAESTIGKGLDLARSLHDRMSEAGFLNQLANARLGQDRHEPALAALRDAEAILEGSRGDARSPSLLDLVGATYLRLGRTSDAARCWRESARLARLHEDKDAEVRALQDLVELTVDGAAPPDGDALQARLAELTGKPAPAPPAPPKRPRKRPRRSAS